MTPDLSILAHLPDRDLRREGLFVSEGRLLTERALRSPWPMEMVACVPRWHDHFAPLTDGRCPLAVVAESAMATLAGFPFHRGVLGLGRRRPLPSPALVAARARLLLGLPEVNTVENLGAVFRSASALGADGVLLGPRAGDALCRRSLKASAGSVFSVPFAECADLGATLRALGGDGWRIAGAVTDAGGQDVGTYQPTGRTLLLLGNEASGLTAEHLALCHDRLTIPMVGDMDSLNLAVAAGILLYALTRPGPGRVACE
jgi:tRNA G18 (ribose-2'-O)-methylase SpoU